jgi:hypothetical protein
MEGRRIRPSGRHRLSRVEPVKLWHSLLTTLTDA